MSWSLRDTQASDRPILPGLCELTRPLQVRSADFNKNGLDDWIICVFGHETGGLYLYQQQPDGFYQRKILRGVPGAKDVLIQDFNGDGWPDLRVLFAYDDEGIWLFTNDKRVVLKQKMCCDFHPCSAPPVLNLPT